MAVILSEAGCVFARPAESKDLRLFFAGFLRGHDFSRADQSNQKIRTAGAASAAPAVLGGSVHHFGRNCLRAMLLSSTKRHTMVFLANVLKVMIASPGDVAAEREIISDELHRWNDANAVSRALFLQPVRWETHSSPEMSGHPQQILTDRLLVDADIVVGIFGTRIGTATNEFVSGSVEEIKRHVAAGKLAMLYFSRVPVDPNSIDQEQWKALQRFKGECREGGLYWEYDTHEQLRSQFGHHLTIELNRPKYAWIPKPDTATDAQDPDLDGNERRLLIAVADDRNGQILTGTTLDGFYVQCNEQNFVEDSTRSVATWKRVLQHLLSLGYIDRASENIYELTEEGFSRAEKELGALPVQVSISVTGSPDKQMLSIQSSRPVKVNLLEFMTSSEASISQTALDTEVKGSAEIPIDHKKVVELFNAPRSYMNHFDLSGPAALAVSLVVRDEQRRLVLPVLLQPKFVNDSGAMTQWIHIVGSKTFSIK
jgi:hypothetical protein